ncbi:MAG: hypothetical protein V3S55_15450 [Nitrospiraceae bacterium]
MADPQVRTIVQALEKVTERIVVEVTLDVTANLIEETPVDTGWARANWVPSIGTPFEANLSDVPSDPRQAAAAATRQESAEARMLTYKLDRGVVFVTNNVPYITKLNLGSSKQAPAGFVQRAIAKAVGGLSL